MHACTQTHTCISHADHASQYLFMHILISHTPAYIFITTFFICNHESNEAMPGHDSHSQWTVYVVVILAIKSPKQRCSSGHRKTVDYVHGTGPIIACWTSWLPLCSSTVLLFSRDGLHVPWACNSGVPWWQAPMQGRWATASSCNSWVWQRGTGEATPPNGCHRSWLHKSQCHSKCCNDLQHSTRRPGSLYYNKRKCV